MAIAAAPGHTNNPNGRPSNAALIERNRRLIDRNADLQSERRVLLEEVATLGRRLISLGTTLEFGYRDDRADLVAFVRADVDRLGRACLRKAGAA